MDSLEYVRGIPAALYKKEPLEFQGFEWWSVSNVLYNDVVTITHFCCPLGGSQFTMGDLLSELVKFISSISGNEPDCIYALANQQSRKDSDLSPACACWSIHEYIAEEVD